jgi:hypothetical protein
MPQDADIGQVQIEVLNRDVNPYQQDPQQNAQMNLAREQELGGINQRIVDDINRFEANGRDITDPQLDPQIVIDSFVDDTRDEVQQFFALGDDDAVDGFLATVVDALADYRNQRGQFAPLPAQPAPAPRPPIRPLDPAAVQQAIQQQQQQQQGTPPRQQRTAQTQQAIFDKAQELGIYQQLTGYSGKSQGQKQNVAPLIRQLAAALNVSTDTIKYHLNRMVGFGMKGGFLGSLLGDAVSDLAGDAFRGATGVSPFEAAKGLVKGAYQNRGTIGDLAKGAFNKFMTKYGGAKRQGTRGRPLRLNNSFTGTSVVPNTLAELKNRLRVAKDGDYIGDSTGAIIPNLQNRGVLGSGRRMEGEGAAEVIAAIGRMSRAAVEQILFPAFNALGQAIAQGVAVGRQIPPRIRSILETTRGVYRREDVQTLLSYLKEHPDVLIPFLPTPYAVVAVAVRLFQHYLNLPKQTGTEAPVGREPRFEREEDDYVVGDGSGRCCFNSGMCRGTKAYRFNYGEKSANVRKESVRGRGRDAEEAIMEGGGNGVNVNIKYSKLPKALQPTDEDLNPTPRPRSASGGMRRRRMPKESYEGFQDEENDVYTHRGGLMEASPLVHSEMLQDKALGLLKGLPRRLGVEDPKFKAKK